jgi:serine/threonine protein kinase
MKEVEAIEKLFVDGTPSNIVAVLKHGSLPESSYYYIDMEFCMCNLEAYIKGRHPETFDATLNPRLMSRGTFHDSQTMNIWDIATELSRGIQFIHEHKQVHRDLKPRNGRHPALQGVWLMI